MTPEQQAEYDYIFGDDPVLDEKCPKCKSKNIIGFQHGFRDDQTTLLCKSCDHKCVELCKNWDGGECSQCKKI